MNTVVGLTVIGIIAGGLIGYFGVPLLVPDDGDGNGNGNGNGTGNQTEIEPLKAGFIYVGPIGDFGWTNAHDVARVYLDEKYDWLETRAIESVPEGEAMSSIDILVADWGADIVFTTSFGFMNATIDAGIKYPDTMFFHISGFQRSANVGTMFADLYQLYYLNGLMAGALTNTSKIGYVGAFNIPELIRHINAFHLGAITANPDVQTHVSWMLTDWFDPTTARTAAEGLVANDIDMLAFTEDSQSTVNVAGENDDVYVFSHYSPMQRFAPDSTISGQLVIWEVMYELILQKTYTGEYNNTNLENVDLLGLLKEGAVELGGEFGVPINTPFVSELQSITINQPDTGDISVYDLIFKRMAQMEDTNVGFEPFTGPLYAQNGTLIVEEDVRMTISELLLFDWFLGSGSDCSVDADGCVVGSVDG